PDGRDLERDLGPRAIEPRQRSEGDDLAVTLDDDAAAVHRGWAAGAPRGDAYLAGAEQAQHRRVAVQRGQERPDARLVAGRDGADDGGAVQEVFDRGQSRSKVLAGGRESLRDLPHSVAGN